jgi:predicted P-loop ATPase
MNMVRLGINKDAVLKGRSLKQDGADEAYKRAKINSQCITGSAVMNEGSKESSNVKELNGLIVVDIDTDVSKETLDKIKNDRYTHVYHKSFGGIGVCVFVRISQQKPFIESFHGISDYYFKTFGVLIDQNCKNTNRLRAISYDPDIYYNQKSDEFVSKYKPKEFKEPSILYTKDDFDYILEQIGSRNIDLCQDDYDRFMRIGFAIFDKFGSGGEGIFKFICSKGSKYEPEKIAKQYKGFCKNGRISIATFYHYCKEANIELYTKKTREIVRAVKVAKSQGSPTVQNIVKHLETVLNIENPDQELVKALIESDKDYNIEDSDESLISQLERYILDAYSPMLNSLSCEVTIKDGKVVDDFVLNTIYIAAKKFFKDKITKNDVESILTSSCVSNFDPVKDYFTNLEGIDFSESDVDKYVDCIHPRTDYNRWVFKKWLIGCIHNWLAPIDETKVSPLSLVLCGKRHGTGKTSFLRELLPKDLMKYYAEATIDIKDKDSRKLLATKLLIVDDEFSGMAMSDVKNYKKVSDYNIMVIRTAYAKKDRTWKRRAGLAGTSNDYDVIKDATGNRRILPILVERIDYDDMISANKDKILAWAYSEYKKSNGIDWKIFKDDEITFLAENTQDNINIDPFEESFFKYFSLTETDVFNTRVFMNKGDILQYFYDNTTLKPTKYCIKDVFVRHNISYKTYRNTDNTIKKAAKLYMKSQNPVYQQFIQESPF